MMTSCHRCKHLMRIRISAARTGSTFNLLWVRHLKTERIISNRFTTTPKATPSKRRNCNIRPKAPLRSAKIKSPHALTRSLTGKQGARHLTLSSFLDCRVRAPLCLSRFSLHTAWSTARWSYPMYCQSAASCGAWVSEKAIKNILSIWQICLRSNSRHWAKNSFAIHKCTGWARPSLSIRCPTTSATSG